MLTLVNAGTSLRQLEAVTAASSTGTPGWLTALIAGLAAIVAAAATAFSSAYVAKRRVAEIEFTNALQMAEKYLESARQYTQGVYLPLAVATHNLHSAFLRFKGVTEESEMPAAKQQFVDDITAFVDFASKQFETGASAVFTFKLDDTLTAFIPFLEKSRSATEVVIIAAREMRYSFGLLDGRFIHSHTIESTSNRRPLLGDLNIDVSILPPPFNAQVRVKRTPVLAAAPLHSDDFADRFTIDVSQIKAAIKEVTLGSFSAPSGR